MCEAFLKSLIYITKFENCSLCLFGIADNISTILADSVMFSFPAGAGPLAF